MNRASDMDSTAASATPRPIGGLLRAERSLGAPRHAANARPFDLWSRDSDLVLRDLVLRKGDTNWANIARAVECDTGMVTAEDCRERWNEIKDVPVKGPWSSEEDEHLKRLVIEYGSKKWNLLARAFPGRSGKQCRERWHNHVDDRVKKGEWTHEEDIILCKAQRQLGNKWSEMSKILTGRSENAIKNRFNSLNAKGLTEKRASELVGKVRLDLNRDFSPTTSGQNSSPLSGTYDQVFVDTHSQDTGRGRHEGLYGLGGGEIRSIGQGSGSNEGEKRDLRRMEALVACLVKYDDIDEYPCWEQEASSRSSGDGDSVLEMRANEVKVGDGQQNSDSETAEAKEGMSVLAKAAGLFDKDDSDACSYSSAGSGGSGVGNGYRPAYLSLFADDSMREQYASYLNCSGIVDHGSTPPGSASPISYVPFSGGTIAAVPYSGGGGGGGGGGGRKVSYGSGGGGAASKRSSVSSSKRSQWYVGPGGVQRRSLESVPGPWRPYWREDVDIGGVDADNNLGSSEPKSKRLKSD